MAEKKIDYDRGVIINTHRTGMDVFMYADDPGIYLSAHSLPVSEEIAKEAGYDTEKLGKERLRKERRLAAMEAIDKDLEDVKDMGEKIIKEDEGFKLVHIGLERYVVRDPEDNQLNKGVLTQVQGEKLLTSMADSARKAKEVIVAKK